MSVKETPPASQSSEDLFELLYDELRKIAYAQMKLERPEHTLQATALINEAYLKLMSGSDSPLWNDEKHFLHLAAKAMRHVLIDSARARTRLKRGGDHIRVDLDIDLLSPSSSSPKDDLLSLHEALLKLQENHPEKAQLVELRFFGGLTIDEAADAMDISRSTAKNHWNFGKTWLYRELTR